MKYSCILTKIEKRKKILKYNEEAESDLSSSSEAQEEWSSLDL